MVCSYQNNQLYYLEHCYCHSVFWQFCHEPSPSHSASLHSLHSSSLQLSQLFQSFHILLRPVMDDFQLLMVPYMYFVLLFHCIIIFYELFPFIDHIAKILTKIKLTVTSMVLNEVLAMYFFRRLLPSWCITMNFPTGPRQWPRVTLKVSSWWQNKEASGWCILCRSIHRPQKKVIPIPPLLIAMVRAYCVLVSTHFKPKTWVSCL